MLFFRKRLDKTLETTDANGNKKYKNYYLINLVFPSMGRAKALHTI